MVARRRLPARLLWTGCHGHPSGARPHRTGRGDRVAPPVTAVGEAGPAGELDSVRIEGIAHVHQKPDFCGEAAAAMALQAKGKHYDQDDVFGLSGMDPARGMGATTRELGVALRAAGFETGPVWYEARADQAVEDMAGQLRALHADLKRGVPSILCMHYDTTAGSPEHFRLVVGYDAADDAILYHEPAVDDGAYQRMTRARLFELWPLRYRADRWTLVRLRLEPRALLEPPPRQTPSRAAFAQHVRALRERLPDGFSIAVESPFVVIGDEPPAQVAQRARSTVRWAVDRLERDYFPIKPPEILDVWLFRDEESYERHALELFGEAPTTPYGYYSARHRALVMNIATGGGTLVHEIVHPYLATNCPGCPTWFNEGLGSLYEQSSSRDDHIVGLPNWRLAGLQRALRRQQVPTFTALTATSSEDFYDRDPGSNYAQSRYLLYYLQEQGLLQRYYQQLRANLAADPTGYATLRSVLGNPDMSAFRRTWEAFVLGLRFP